MKTLSHLLSILVGLMLAAALLVLGGAMVARYFILKLTALPPKPVFANDLPAKPSPVASPSPKPSPVAASPSASPSPMQLAQASPSPKPSPVAASPQPSPTSSPSNGYRVRVVQPIGLVLRGSPSRDSSQVGGIDYNQQVTVVEESQDGEWIKVRLEPSNQEGWVRSGNTERLRQ